MQDIVDEIARYRKLKAKRDDLDASMALIKVNVKTHLAETGEPYKDADGYARIQTRKAGKRARDLPALHRAATIWAQSEDAIQSACGQQVLAHIAETKESTFVSIR